MTVSSIRAGVSDCLFRHGSYREFQRYFCKHCDRSFNTDTGMIFGHSTITPRKWMFSICAFPRFHTCLRQLQVEIDVYYETIHQRVKRA